MATALRWLPVVALGLVLMADVGAAKTGSGRPTALAAYPSTGAIGEEGLKYVVILGGRAGERGWVSSSDAKGLTGKGDRLPVYALESGQVGSAVLTDAGTAWPWRGPGTWPAGLWHMAKVQFARGKGEVGKRQPLIALWHAPGTPEPRWVPAQETDAKSRASRRTVTEWLRQRGYSKKEIDEVQLRQVVQADVNGDGRSDTLLSFDWFESPDLLDMDPYAYLLLRLQASGSAKAQTMVVATESEYEQLRVIGLCDLDRDGWAEVAVDHSGLESWGGRLYYHTPKGFRFVQGDLLGI